MCGVVVREGGWRLMLRGRSSANVFDVGRFESGTSASVMNFVIVWFVCGGRYEYEVIECVEWLFCEWEKVMDDLVGVNVRERARRAKIEKEKKMECCVVIKCDLVSDSEEDGI